MYVAGAHVHGAQKPGPGHSLWVGPHQTIKTSEDEDRKMVSGLTLIQEGLVDTGC